MKTIQQWKKWCNCLTIILEPLSTLIVYQRYEIQELIDTTLRLFNRSSSINLSSLRYNHCSILSNTTSFTEFGSIHLYSLNPQAQCDTASYWQKELNVQFQDELNESFLDLLMKRHYGAVSWREIKPCLQINRNMNYLSWF